MAFLDFLRRRLREGPERSRRRGMRAARGPQRRSSEGTRQIPAPSPSAVPPQPPPATPPPPPGPAPTVVARPASPAPAAAPTPPRPAAPSPAPADEGKTEYVDVRRAIASQVVGVLVAVDGELEGQVFRVSDGENKLGRSKHCEIELASKRISREHAKVIHRDGVFAIAPLSDQNPTLVNDETLPSEGAELKDGDYVRLGRTTLRFRSVV